MTTQWHTLLLFFPALVLFAVLMPLYLSIKWRGEHRKSIVVKALCTLVVVILCYNGCYINEYIGFWWIFAGLIFCLIGDVAIEFQLFAGMGAFLIGHCLFIYAFIVMEPLTWQCIPGFIFFYVLVGLVLRKRLKGEGLRLIPYSLYAAAAILMFSLTLTLPLSIGTGCMVAGAGLFVLSDVLLARNILGKKEVSHRSQAVSLACYYAGLYLMAFAVWM